MEHSRMNNQPEELQKAIEITEYKLRVGSALHWGDIEHILFAAKRTQQAEKERDELKATIQLMEHGKYGRVHLSDRILELEQERDQLKSALVKCADFLTKMQHAARVIGSDTTSDYPYVETPFDKPLFIVQASLEKK